MTILPHSPMEKTHLARTKDEFLNSCRSYNPFFVVLIIVMSLNWGLSGMFLVVPAYISPSESTQNLTGFVKIQDEFNLSDSYIDRVENVASSFSAGNLLLGTVMARLSDSYGRRPVIIVSIMLTGILGLVTALSPTYEVLLAARFLQGVFYSATTLVNWVLVSESTPKKLHATAGVVFGISWIVGSSLVAPVVIFCPDWRTTLVALSVPNIVLAIILIWTLPESLDFSLQRRDTNALEKFVTAVLARDSKALQCDYESIITRSRDNQKTTAPSILNFLKLFVTDFQFLKFVSIACFMCFTSTLLHNAMSLTSTVIEVGDIHWNFVLSSTIEIPSYIFVPFLFNRLGRISTLFLFHVLTTLANFGVVLVTTENYIPYLIFWLLAKFACSSAFMCFLIFSSELFPVEYRNLCIGLCMTVGNIGAVIAPQCTALNNIRDGLMFTVFGASSFLSALLTWFLPSENAETRPSELEKDKNVDDIFEIE